MSSACEAALQNSSRRGAAPGRFIAGLDLRFVAATGEALAATPAGAPLRLLPVDTLRALYRAGAFRARLQSALTLEEVLVRHPRLRLYVMHAGYPLREDLQALLFTHPQVYVELSMAVNVEARPAFYRFLRELVEAGYGDRIMFGSDQMVWPGLIDAGVQSINAAPFLTAAQKRDMLYNNAARFLRLTLAEIAQHHGR